MHETGDKALAFDFTTKAILQEAISRGEYGRLKDAHGKPPGVIGWEPQMAVTFLDNHDTGSTQNHWPFPSHAVHQVRPQCIPPHTSCHSSSAVLAIMVAVVSISTAEPRLSVVYSGRCARTAYVLMLWPALPHSCVPVWSFHVARHMHCADEYGCRVLDLPSASHASASMQGYAYILTHPGVPCVFYDHVWSNGMMNPSRWRRMKKLLVDNKIIDGSGTSLLQPLQDCIIELLALRKRVGINATSQVRTRGQVHSGHCCVQLVLRGTRWAPTLCGNVQYAGGRNGRVHAAHYACGLTLASMTWAT